jgi:hypothetical protein
MSAPKTYTEVQCLVRNEINSIQKRDGELPPTAYVVMELATRLKNLQPWMGYDQKKTLAVNLKGVIEEFTKGKPNPNRIRNAEDKDMDVIWISPNPIEALDDQIGNRRLVGAAVDRAPIGVKKEKLKKRLRQAS